MKFQTIYFVAGEVSADNHGAALMRSLRELDGELNFVGRGGPQMQEVAGGAIQKLDRRGGSSRFMGGAQEIWLFPATISRNAPGNSREQTRRSRPH